MGLGRPACGTLVSTVPIPLSGVINASLSHPRSENRARKLTVGSVGRLRIWATRRRARCRSSTGLKEAELGAVVSDGEDVWRRRRLDWVDGVLAGVATWAEAGGAELAAKEDLPVGA